MTLSEFRIEMEDYRRAAEKEARALKDSYLVLDRLHSLYDKLNSEERVMANEVLAEWALSEDEHVRFDSEALIDDFKISAAVPTLKELADRLASSNAVGAPFELHKVDRILRDLGHTHGHKTHPDR
jgi:cysteinyl-tRNA synthetase